MIYISTGSFAEKNLFSCVENMIQSGFKNIELTGGFNHTPGLEEFLIQKKSKCNFRLHNYFPPPEKHFVVNLCGNEKNVELSMTLLSEAILLSEKIDSHKFGFHAGFRVAAKPSDLGKVFKANPLIDKKNAIDLFKKNFQNLNKLAVEHGVELYLENNVLTPSNLKVYMNENPFLLTCAEEVEEFFELFSFKLILDVGHLKVSSRSLSLDFEDQMVKLLSKTDYLHISDNSGEADENRALTKDSELFSILSNNRSLLRNKDFTVEVYSGVKEVIGTIDLLESII